VSREDDALLVVPSSVTLSSDDLVVSEAAELLQMSFPVALQRFLGSGNAQQQQKHLTDPQSFRYLKNIM